jgi:hypothetical protein
MYSKTIMLAPFKLSYLSFRKIVFVFFSFCDTKISWCDVFASKKKKERIIDRVAFATKFFIVFIIIFFL